MAKKLFISILILIIAISVVVAAILSTQPPAEIRLSGLNPGDEFLFDLEGSASGNYLDVTLPENFSELNMTDWYKVTVTSVNGPEILLNTTWRFTNGSEINKPGKVNLLTGIGNQEFWAIYAANLTAKSLARPGGSDMIRVNQTEIRTYKDGDRETNLISLQNQYIDVSDPSLSRTYNNYLFIYFDKQTGMLVELRNIQIYSNPEVVLTIVWEIKDSNVWTIS